MLQLSKSYRVIYVNNYSFRHFLRKLLHIKKSPGYEVNDNLMVYTPFGLPTLQMRFPVTRYLNNILVPFLVRRKINKLKIKTPILWMYHPRYIDRIGQFKEELIVYDCMDDFVSLRSVYEVVEEIKRNEIELLKRADLVFGGGYSIADLKSEFRDDIHVFPSACELEHFNKSLSPDIKVPFDIKDIPRPILGYWGAIDERIDHGLLKRLALKRPDWSIVLLGPLAKLNIEDVPYFNELNNVFWLGPKDYSLLPGYARAFDVCLNPFVVTKAGRHLSPTKTLEYLATGKPVVSTPITDVVRFYNGLVSIADSAEEFENAVEKYLNEDNEIMQNKRIDFTEGKTWEDTAHRMEELIIRALKSTSYGKV
jgi:glycosyltransferase involved in cell wall biosynthesis